jgi:prepilin-type processing-associated H-X9-DG protein
MPSLAKARTKAQGLQCLGNARQLGLAWLLYADDHDGKLTPNEPYTPDNWVSGTMTYLLHDSDNTNVANLLDPKFAKLGPYVRAAAIYKCPSDRSFVQGSGTRYPRVRSVSMNFAVGSKARQGDLPFAPGWMVYRKSQDALTPSSLWVFGDEHPDSIDDAAFVVDCGKQGYEARLISFPANYHNGGTSFAFADGHAETHRWQNETTKYPNKYCGCLSHYAANGFYTAAPYSPDVAWLQERTSVKLSPSGAR